MYKKMRDRRTYTITGSSNDWTVTWVDGQTHTMHKAAWVLRPVDTLSFEFGRPGNTVTLLWEQCTSPGPPTSMANLFSLIRALGSSSSVDLSSGFAALSSAGGRLVTKPLREVSSTGAYSEAIVSGGTYTFPTSTFTVATNVFNGNDASGGLGLRSMLVKGLDANLEEVEEIVTTDGSGNGPFGSVNFRRVNEVLANEVGTEAGSNYTSSYIITSGGVRLEWLGDGFGGGTGSSYGVGVGALGMYTIPAGFTGYVTSVWIRSTNTGSSSAHGFKLCQAPVDGHRVRTLMDWSQGWNSDSNAGRHTYPIPYPVPEKTDVWVAVRGLANVVGHMSIILIPN